MIIPFEPEHAFLVNLQERQQKGFSHVDGYALYDLDSPSYTYVEEGQGTACFGIVPYWKGRATVWALIGEVKNWVAFHRAVNSYMESHVKEYGIIRLEMTTEVGFTESERWARMLGFHKESLMPCYGPEGEDHINWVRLWQFQH